MKLSTRSRYGIRLMLELSKNYGKGTIFLKDIARNQEISEKYLSQLIIPLRGAGLVQSTRGAHGGYSLGKPAAEISLYEIVKALDGPISVVECVTNPKVCSRYDICPTQKIWKGLNDSMIRYLTEISLESLLSSCSDVDSDNFYSI
ncbi:MAG TPA: Rrf2 family transcriptional regulator [Spirochaetota bacterium]|nr:Rrf2 family transcriptional regulator [Spirochaetota bacterium]